MPLTVRLDNETEHCLKELLAETGQDRSSLIRQTDPRVLAAAATQSVDRAADWRAP